MTTLLWIACLLATPFWESIPAKEWSEEQLIEVLNQSPWTQAATEVSRSRKLSGPPVMIYLAGAKPMLMAEEELIRRRFKQDSAAFAAISEARQEYKTYLAEQAGKIIIVAIPLQPNALADGGETKRMEEESTLKIGKSKVKTIGHFPPTQNDPILRLIFPREIPAGAKDVTVEVYLPSVTDPYRSVQFRLKDLVYQGVPDL